MSDGEWLTTGDPLSYLRAVLKYAADRQDIGTDLTRLIKDLYTSRFKDIA